LTGAARRAVVTDPASGAHLDEQDDGGKTDEQKAEHRRRRAVEQRPVLEVDRACERVVAHQ
jgi:hypothetical protein